MPEDTGVASGMGALKCRCTTSTAAALTEVNITVIQKEVQKVQEVHLSQPLREGGREGGGGSCPISAS